MDSKLFDYIIKHGKMYAMTYGGSLAKELEGPLLKDDVLWCEQFNPDSERRIWYTIPLHEVPDEYLTVKQQVKKINAISRIENQKQKDKQLEEDKQELIENFSLEMDTTIDVMVSNNQNNLFSLTTKTKVWLLEFFNHEDHVFEYAGKSAQLLQFDYSITVGVWTIYF